jgi:hypothetical protein
MLIIHRIFIDFLNLQIVSFKKNGCCFEILMKLILHNEKSLHPLFALYFSLFSPIVQRIPWYCVGLHCT